MKIARNNAMPSVEGPASWFTGSVRIDSPFQAKEDGRSGGAIVTFEPGARTNWHTHPAGQTLVVLNGVGWTQCDGGQRTEIRAGDVVWCPCRKRHWHGASISTRPRVMSEIRYEPQFIDICRRVWDDLRAEVQMGQRNALGGALTESIAAVAAH